MSANGVRAHPNPIGYRGSLEERFWRRVEKGPGCWEWRGATTGEGYGVISVGNVRFYAHRVAHELQVGAIPEGLTVDHLCFNRLCVRAEHLEAVTRAENVLRAVARREENRRVG